MAPLQIIMATEHDYMFFQPEDDSGWSCGPFTIVKVEITVVQFCIENILTSYLDLKMLNEVFGRLPCNSSFKKDDVVKVKSMIQQMNEKVAPFKWYNHAPLGLISGCIKIDKKLKENFLSDDSPSGIKLKKFADSYRTAVEKWRSKILDKTRRTILGSLGVKKNK